MRNLVRDNFILFKRCGKTLLPFELIYKAVAVAVFYPLFLLLFNLSMKLSGIKYLTNGYILRFLLHPCTILILIMIVLIVAVYNFFEKCCMSVLLEAALQEKKVSVFEMFTGGIRNFRLRVRAHNVLMLLYEIFLFPFSNIIILGLVLINLSLPEYITRSFGGRDRLNFVLIAVCILLFVLAIRSIFTTNYLLNEGGDFSIAYKNSASLIRGRVVKTVLLMLFWNILVCLVVGALFLVISFIVILGTMLLDMTHVGIALYLTVIKTVKTVITLALVLISSPMSYMVITSMFFRYRSKDIDNGQSVSEVTREILEHPPECKKGLRFAAIMSTVIAFTLICVYIFRAIVANPFDRVELLQVPEITAHRGSSLVAPENTMAAFTQAVEDVADYIELDVHLTSDNMVVVLHDNSLKRTTGLAQNVWQTSYDVIKKLDAGSWFSPEFANEPIPTLEEVIESVGDDVKLNIEVKYNKKEQGLTQRVVDIIEYYHLENRCVVTSSDYSVLQEVKRLNEDIRTGYILSAAYGAYYSAGNVDIISINYNYVNKALVDAVHGNGKEIYVWTVNSPNVVRSLANMGVDNIITDDPVMAREVVYSRYSVRELVNILDYVFGRNSY